MTTQDRIRRIFLQPEATYSVSAAADLLEYSYEQVVASIEHGDLAVNHSGGIARVPWEEVALAASERWPQDLIEAALGGDVSEAMPELVRLTELLVRVPRFSVIAVARVAQRERTTIDHIVARQLLDFSVAESEALDRSVAGFSAAMRWPVA